MDENVSRRRVLGAAGAGLVGAGLAGTVQGALTTDTATDSDEVQVNVGYADRSALGRVRRAGDVVREFAFDVVTLRTRPAMADRLASLSGVRFVEPDVELEASAQTLPWGIDRVDAEVAHSRGAAGADATVAVIDTGIDFTHTDLSVNQVASRVFVGGAAAVPGGQDDNGHGTHCAGILGARNDEDGVVGVAPEVELHAYKALNAAGVGLTSDIAAAIQYAGDAGVDVASLSLGGGDTTTLREACAYADDRGVLLVAAAGNNGPCSGCLDAPAWYDETVAVSATRRDDSLASFSSTGRGVDIAAPGAEIYSTDVGGGYTTLSGTSMACPHVSGAAAQLMARGLTNDDARTRLASTAEDVGLGRNESGAGLLDVATALGYDSRDDR